MSSRKTGVCFRLLIPIGIIIGILSGCTPPAAVNVIGYEIETRLGLLPPPPYEGPTGQLTGRILDPAGEPIHNAVALVAARTGEPYTAHTDANGLYRITSVPPGQYVPAAVAPHYTETALHGLFNMPRLITVTANQATQAPDLILTPHTPRILPAPQAANLQQSAAYSATAVFPPDAQANAWAYTYLSDGLTVDTLRVYLPTHAPPGADAPTNQPAEHPLPTLFMIYPTHSDAWQEVSVAYAAQGYAFVAVSPMPERDLDIDAHAQDARVAFHLARAGLLHPQIDTSRVVALGGSFSSAILHRFLRDEAAQVDAWINVGGISNAFTGAAEFYRGDLEMPPEFEYAIPALGPANIYPLPFLRYSPVYTAGQLPATLIVHTAADRIATIDQAYQLEAALQAANVPVETYYYTDDSHYLLIGEDMTAAGVAVYEHILGYIHTHIGP